MQDIALCEERYPMAICRPIALQFTGEDSVALLELTVREENQTLMLNTIDEKHYQLIPRSEISNSELTVLKDRENDNF
jgi:hypothetical protein